MSERTVRSRYTRHKIPLLPRLREPCLDTATDGVGGAFALRGSRLPRSRPCSLAPCSLVLHVLFVQFLSVLLLRLRLGPACVSALPLPEACCVLVPDAALLETRGEAVVAGARARSLTP